jgi:hypothetical protein
MYDPLPQTHRELRIALRYATRELQRVTMTARRIRLPQQSERILRESKAAAVAASVSKMPGKPGIDYLSKPSGRRNPPTKPLDERSAATPNID